jgi:predicted MPP superfamily phosphohydrolase
VNEQRSVGYRLTAALLRKPYRDELGRKGWLERWSRAPPHLVQRLGLTIAGWPRFERPLRIAFLSDFHAGSHAGDIARFASIADEAAALAPDLVLFGGDYVNTQLFGGGRLPPDIIAAVIARTDGLLGRFAILGNHDYMYGGHEVAAALRSRGIVVLDHERRTVVFEGRQLDIVGVPDARVIRPEFRALLCGLSRDRPTIVLAHDPVWFADVPPGPFLTLAGHTHGGQIRLPGIGVVKNASRAPLRWSHGLVVEDGRQLYVTAGLGTSVLPLRIGVPPEFAVLDVNGG